MSKPSGVQLGGALLPLQVPSGSNHQSRYRRHSRKHGVGHRCVWECAGRRKKVEVVRRGYDSPQPG